MAPFFAKLAEKAQPKVREIRETPLPQAHFVERHLIVSGSWETGCRKLAEAFPRETRPERPANWYRLLAGTHWPGRIPPGNGPFYMPEWAFTEEEYGERVRALKTAGFREVVAHVVVLPTNGEYLGAALRAAGSYRWNANPYTYRAYLYPKLPKGKAKDLRDYNTERLER